jgi:hypothetical protein
MKPSKGAGLILALGAIGIISVVVATLLLSLSSRLRRVEIWMDRTKAYYLCQTGLSVAMLDLAAGRVPASIPAAGYSRTFSFPMGGRYYNVTYKITTETEGWRRIKASTSSPLGLGYAYYLESGGRRAFPIFIRGFGGK